MGHLGKLQLPEIVTSSSVWFNKYAITLAAFVVWMAFFDTHSIVNQFRLNKAIAKLETEKANYEDALEKALLDRKSIESDLEKYAREKYLFHKDNEEIILFK